MLPEDVQSERKTYREISLFEIIPIVKYATAPEVTVTAEGIEEFEKELHQVYVKVYKVHKVYVKS